MLNKKYEDFGRIADALTLEEKTAIFALSNGRIKQIENGDLKKIKKTLEKSRRG